MAKTGTDLANQMMKPKFDGRAFEKDIPYNMRYKHWDDWDQDGIINWVTQDDFTDDDIETFKNAMRKHGVNKAHVILRDNTTGNLYKDILGKKGRMIDLTNQEHNEEKHPEKLLGSKSRFAQKYPDRYENMKNLYGNNPFFLSGNKTIEEADLDEMARLMGVELD